MCIAQSLHYLNYSCGVQETPSSSSRPSWSPVFGLPASPRYPSSLLDKIAATPHASRTGLDPHSSFATYSRSSHHGRKYHHRKQYHKTASSTTGRTDNLITRSIRFGIRTTRKTRRSDRWGRGCRCATCGGTAIDRGKRI